MQDAKHPVTLYYLYNFSENKQVTKA